MFTVRSATPADAAAACNVLRRSISEVCALDYNNDALLSEWLSNKTEKNVRQWIESDRTHGVVCLDGEGQLVGFGMLAASGEILLNYLIPEALHLGNGRKQLEFMEQIAKQQGIVNLSAESTITAKAFYQRNGFVDSGKPIMEQGLVAFFPLSKIL